MRTTRPKPKANSRSANNRQHPGAATAKPAPVRPPARKKEPRPSRGEEDLRRRAETSLRESKKERLFDTIDREALIHELRVYQMELEIQNQELREAQIELSTARDRYLDLYEFAPVGYLMLDQEGTIRESNLMAPALLGTERSGVIGKPLARFLSPEALRGWRRHQADALASEGKQVAEFPIRSRDRRDRVLRFESIGFDDRSGMRCALVDVTERRRADENLEVLNRGLELRMAARTAQLEESNRELRERIAENERITRDLHRQTARLRTILETAADGIITVDARGRIETCNPAAERMFGYTAEELLGRNVGLLTPLPHSTKRSGQRKPSKTGDSRLLGTWHEHIGQRKDGSTFPIDLTAGEFYDGEAKFTEVVRDITERKRLQWEIVQRVTEEQQSIGRALHDGVAQHATAAEMMLGLLEKNLRNAQSEQADLAADALQAIREAQSQLRVTIRGVLPYTVQALGLEAALTELVKTTGKLHGIQCDLKRKGRVEIDDANHATQLYYIASEAVHNAVRHARPSRIIVALLGKRTATELRVHDDGIGIRSKQAKRGAGLRIMRYRASLIGATLDVGSAEGGGTVVTCLAPNARKK